MTVQEHEITLGDRLTAIGAVLTRDGSAVDLTGYDSPAVKFKMVHLDGEVIVAESSDGVSVVSAIAGKVQYVPTTSDIDAMANKLGSETRMVCYAWFTVYDGGLRDSFPVGRKFKVTVHALG